MSALATLWLSSLAVAGFGTWVLFDASIGLNWALRPDSAWALWPCSPGGTTKPGSPGRTSSAPSKPPDSMQRISCGDSRPMPCRR
jgi:hypothetical protein